MYIISTSEDNIMKSLKEVLTTGTRIYHCDGTLGYFKCSLIESLMAVQELGLGYNADVLRML